MTSRVPLNLKWLEVISYNIISNIESFFKRLGQKVAEKPWHTILICLVTVILTTLGYFRFYQERNPVKLWVPPHSEFSRDTEWLINTYKQAYRPQLMLIKAKNVLEPEILREVNVIYNRIKYSTTDDNITWPDVCFKIPVVDITMSRLLTGRRRTNTINDNKSEPVFEPSVHIDSFLYCIFIDLLKRDCYQRNILELWNYDIIKLNITKADILNKLAETDISPTGGLPANYESLLGGIKRNSTGHIIAASTLLSMWMVNVNFTAVDMDKTGNDLGTSDWISESGLKWEKTFINIMNNVSANAKNMKIFYISGRSFSDVSETTMKHDIPALALGVFLMITYIQISYSKYNCIESRILIGFLGLLSIGMAFIVTCGLCSLFGIFYGPVHTSLPFLLMGLGVDDMFVIMACWNQLSLQEKRLPLPERIGVMLQHAGVSITVTSVTDFMAFLVGSFTVLPSLKSFCLYAAVGVLTTFLLVLTFFTACFALDQERSEQYRNSLVPCYKHKNIDKNSCSQKQYTKKIFYFVYDKIILTTPGKVAVIILTIVLTGIGIEGTLQLRQEFDPMWFIPESSYLNKYIMQRKLYYPLMGFEANLFVGKVNYTHEYKNIKSLVSKLENQTDILQVTNSWVQPFHNYVKNFFDRDIDEEILSEDEWNSFLSKFLFSPKGARFQANIKFEQDLKCGSPATQITASSIDFRLRLLHGPKEHLSILRRLYEIKNGAGFTTGDRFATVWAKVFANWVTDEVIDKELARNLGLALLSVMFCTTILIANLQICFWIFICVLLTMVNVCGWMQKWNLTIDIVSCIVLTLAVGLCVDYAAHIGYTFLSVSEGTKRDRTLLTISNIGIAVLHGGLSTLVALSMLANSEAYTFQTFFKIFLLVILFGQFHGIVLLPVILSTVGPKPYQHIHRNSNN